MEGLVAKMKGPSTEDDRENEYAALSLRGPHYNKVCRQTYKYSGWILEIATAFSPLGFEGH